MRSPEALRRPGLQCLRPSSELVLVVIIRRSILVVLRLRPGLRVERGVAGPTPRGLLRELHGALTDRAHLGQLVLLLAVAEDRVLRLPALMLLPHNRSTVDDECCT